MTSISLYLGLLQTQKYNNGKIWNVYFIWFQIGIRSCYFSSVSYLNLGADDARGNFRKEFPMQTGSLMFNNREADMALIPEEIQ